jgi:GNAT superfamily N-acetyltransferase
MRRPNGGMKISRDEIHHEQVIAGVAARRILPVSPADLDEVGTFVAHVILTSVDASDEEKGRFIQNTQSNLRKVADAPDDSVHLKCLGDEGLTGVVLVRDYWNLCHLFVAPGVQRQGIGRALLEAAIAGCRGRSPRGAIVLNSSRNAVGFYRHFGFVGVPDASQVYRGLRLELSL